MFRPPFGAPLGGGFKGGAGKGKGGFEEEDRSRDWYCIKCRERNFVKRTECFKCGASKPKGVDCSAPPKPNLPPNGTTLNGMVKSYNRKGFGFLMCFGIEHCSDIHYTRENLSPKLQTRDIPGQHVTFELHRAPDGKLAALNIRPIGEDRESQHVPCGKGQVGGKGGPAFVRGARGEEEDRSRDWLCSNCGERNFVKRFECFKCKTTIKLGAGGAALYSASRSTAVGGFSEGAAGGDVAPEPRRTVSPHAGSRAWRDVYAAAAGSGSSASRSRGRRKKRRRRRSRSKSSSSSSSSSRAKGKSNKKRRKRSRSKSSSSDSESSDCKMEDPSGGGARGSGGAESAAAQSNGNPEIEKAKSEALEELMRLQKLEKEARMSEFRALLRKWHPDKNPDRVEVATAVFQFLQKGKPMLDAK